MKGGTKILWSISELISHHLLCFVLLANILSQNSVGLKRRKTKDTDMKILLVTMMEVVHRSQENILKSPNLPPYSF